MWLLSLQQMVSNLCYIYITIFTSTSISNSRYSTWWIILKSNSWCMPSLFMLDADDTGIKRFLPMLLMHLANYSSTNIWVWFHFSNSIVCGFHLLCLETPKILLWILNVLIYQNWAINISLLIITIANLHWVLTFRHYYLI